MRDACIFRKIPTASDLPRNAFAYSRYDQYPVSPGHWLIVPLRHVADYFETTAEEKQALWALVEFKKMLKAINHRTHRTRRKKNEKIS